MITVIVPAAGNGSRFAEAGYAVPKMMIPVCDVPMLRRVLDNLTPDEPHRTVVISRLHHAEISEALGVNDTAVHLPYPTEGAIDTLLKARNFATSEPLLIGNVDQLVRFDVNDFIASARGSDGALVTFRSSTPHHSYVTVDHTGAIASIREKEVISNQAVTGVYYFTHGLEFMKYATQVVRANTRYNSEFYVSSAIARMVDDGKRLTTYDAPTAILGTPGELQLFEMAVEVAASL